MSWLRSAVNKAVEVGNKNNLTRTVKNYADSVVQQAGQAVAEGAKLLQDRIGGRNVKSFKQTVKRLEEASVSCRGRERVELMRRWLAVLKEIEKSSSSTFEDKEKNNEQHQLLEEPKSPRRQSMVLYYDSDMGGEPLTFRDVFLYSQALEGISICMILEPPNEDEVSLLLELFGLCLTGGIEVHNAIVSSIQDLAKVFSSYQDEVLVKREELLQFAEGAITGLKINAEIQRIDAEVYTLKKQLESRASHSHDGDSQETNIKQSASPTIEALKEALAHIRACSRLEALLLKKKAIKCGDTSEIHSQKVDKLKVLLESLASSSSKSEKRISDFRVQKEDALKFRVSKVSEVTEIEKELAAEISDLEKQRDELEAQLKKVNISLSAVRARLHNATEERDQFFDANDQIVAHLKTKEDELAKSIGSCRTEADILSTWINFLEDTWSLQCSYVEAKEKETNAEIERHEDYFTNLVKQLLSSYEKELRPPIDRIGKYVENLKSLGDGSSPTGPETDDSQMVNPKRNLEEEYLDYEAKIITTFSVVDNMREQFYAQQGKLSSKENQKIKELFDNIEKLRAEFESIERPTLDLENPTKESDASPSESVASSFTEQAEKEASAGKDDRPQRTPPKSEQMLDPEAELAKLESEFGNVNQEYSTEEIGEWEFDELEKELRSGDSSRK
ncbi:structural maintenance of chromosomes protein [Perilla frutescens var. hirtella]|uniref:Structural maintenance of chromosomes protein n=1 Tax=Perilla frutescens var. hirtella TaxID=608512 RepID=A0AAD4P542_PERFH|nr:structural maintenance of chromosomes protein [Perilla frutescens var. hirtella]